MEVRQITAGLTTLSFLATGVTTGLAVYTHKAANAALNALTQLQTSRRNHNIACEDLGIDIYCGDKSFWTNELANYECYRTASIVAAAFLLIATAAGAGYLYRCYKQHTAQNHLHQV